MLTRLYTNRQLIAGRMGVEPIPLLRWFQPSSPQAPAAVPSNLTSLHESFLLLSSQPAGGFSSQPSQALFNKLLVFYPQANGTTQSVFVVDTIASSICGRHIRQCLFPIGDTILNIFPLKPASSFSFPKTYLSYMSVSIILPFRFTNRIKHFQNFSSVFI